MTNTTQLETSGARRELERKIARCWPAARARWSRFLLLADPMDNPEQESIAQIHLGSRQVSLRYDMLLDKDLLGSVEALLAHEIGHHVRYPGTLATQARMRLLERSLLPFREFSLINQFTDLMINERLGRDLQDQLVAVYQAFGDRPAFHEERLWRRDPSFTFYLAIYEELWRLEPGSLIKASEAEFEAEFSNFRAEAQMLSQDLFHLGPNIFTQFLYFVSIVSRYVRPLDSEECNGNCECNGDREENGNGRCSRREPRNSNPLQCGCDDPSADDWADALTPSAQEREAIRRAIEGGWLRAEQQQRLTDVNELEDRIARLPGADLADAQLVPEVMAAYYRQQAERYLLRPPPQRRLGEAIVPTTLEEWEPGDAAGEIDWLATLLQRGDVLGAATPLKRSRIAEEEGREVAYWQPRIEIYLDVSGSTPDPRRGVNAMTLAAQILTLGAARAGGWTRAAIYSNHPVCHWEWTRSETEISRFLMHYVGGGTNFPFPLLDRSIRECGRDQPIRVIISDVGFDHNYAALLARSRDNNPLVKAITASPRVILMQHRPNPVELNRYRDLGADVVPVRDMEDFPRMAADLARALFPD
ncbi:MAG: hypothetical protein N2C14_24935 [Planctomycetales bacterium]